MFIHDKGKGVELTDVHEFCTLSPGDNEDCVTSFYDSSASCVSSSSDVISVVLQGGNNNKHLVNLFCKAFIGLFLPSGDKDS